MDAPTATVIAALIGAVASISVALINTRTNNADYQPSSDGSISGDALTINNTSGNEPTANAAKAATRQRRFFARFAIITLYVIASLLGFALVPWGYIYLVSSFFYTLCFIDIMFFIIARYLHRRLLAS